MKLLITLFFIGISLSLSAQWTQQELSLERSSITSLQFEKSLVFAGGSLNGDLYEQAKKRIDLYDSETDSWITDSLSVVRQEISIAYSDNKLYFAGFTTTFKQDQDIIEIYDLKTKEWSEMKFPNIYGASGLVTAEEYIIGYKSGDVDIFNPKDSTWISGQLNPRRSSASVLACNGKVFFAGGGSLAQGTYHQVDILDIATMTWKNDSLSVPKNQISCSCIENKAYFSGGQQDFSIYSNVIEIFDTEKETWDIITTPEFNNNYSSSKTETYLYMGEFDISPDNRYSKITRMNLETNEFEDLFLPEPRAGISLATLDEKLFVAGGFTLDFEYSKSIDIYDEVNSSINEADSRETILSVSPNPARDYIEFTISSNELKDYCISDISGRIHTKGKSSGLVEINALQPGMYFITIDGQSMKFIKLH